MRWRPPAGRAGRRRGRAAPAAAVAVVVGREQQRRRGQPATDHRGQRTIEDRGHLHPRRRVGRTDRAWGLSRHAAPDRGSLLSGLAPARLVPSAATSTVYTSTRVGSVAGEASTSIAATPSSASEVPAWSPAAAEHLADLQARRGHGSPVQAQRPGPPARARSGPPPSRAVPRPSRGHPRDQLDPGGVRPAVHLVGASGPLGIDGQDAGGPLVPGCTSRVRGPSPSDGGQVLVLRRGPTRPRSAPSRRPRRATATPSALAVPAAG
jgi:hypothetical protein